VGKKNLTRKTDRQKSKDRLEVRKAAAVADVVIPALTKHQMVDATLKALFLFNKKLLQVRKLNEAKVIVISIAVTAEGLHPSRRNAGHSIVRETQQASLWNDAGMANLVRLPYRPGFKKQLQAQDVTAKLVRSDILRKAPKNILFCIKHM
jgi:hypothetical protein